MTVLDHHESALASLRAGLVDLEASPSFLMISNDELGPMTKSKIGRAADGVGQLWPLINAADGALSHMRDHVTTNGAKGRSGSELVRLLSERWITVEGTSGPRSIAEVLQAYRDDYDAIRSWVTEINDLWLQLLPRIDAARSTLARLEAEVAELGVPEPLIGRAQALVVDLESRLVDDPLAVVTGDGDGLDAQVAEAAAQVASMRSGHDSLETDLSATEELLARLRLLRAQAEAAASESRAKVAETDGLIRVPAPAVLDGDGGLAERLDDLFAKTAASNPDPNQDSSERDAPGLTWNQRRSLLDSWLSTARKLEAQLERAVDANRAPLTRREELRGRLRAYQAKVSATGNAEDLDVTAIADEARSLLYTAPADLTGALTAIDELARRLRR